MTSAIQTGGSIGEAGLSGATLSAIDQGLLTPRQREALLWVAEGKTTDEVAAILACTPRTVRAHIDMACARLGAFNRARAVARGFICGILRPLAIALPAVFAAANPPDDLFRMARMRRPEQTTHVVYH